jgi:hypothetical protein
MERERNLLNSQTMPASSSSVREIRARIAFLALERQRLDEEVGQLQAAVQIYTEVVRRWALAARGQDSVSRQTPAPVRVMPMNLQESLVSCPAFQDPAPAV